VYGMNNIKTGNSRFILNSSLPENEKRIEKF
jgi:hypothetical protein